MNLALTMDANRTIRVSVIPTPLSNETLDMNAYFDADKALHALLFIAKSVDDPDVHRIFKILYFAEKQHLAQYGRLICGDSYVAMPYGPVPTCLYDLLKDIQGRGASSFLDTNPGLREAAKRMFAVEEDNRVTPRIEVAADVFSESDVECLREAIRQYGPLTFRELTDLSHDQAWQQTQPNKHIEVETIIKSLPDSAALLEYFCDSSLARP